MAEIKVTSSAFEHSKPIPRVYTCEGKDISPPLKFSGIPSGTKSLAIIVDDPDAPPGDWVHWVAWNLEPSITKLDEGAAVQLQGKNDFGKNRYGGPCPPIGHGTHRYFFKIFALDTMLDLPAKTSKKDLLAAISSHVLAKGELMGTYERR